MVESYIWGHLRGLPCYDRSHRDIWDGVRVRHWGLRAVWGCSCPEESGGISRLLNSYFGPVWSVRIRRRSGARSRPLNWNLGVICVCCCQKRIWDVPSFYIGTSSLFINVRVGRGFGAPQIFKLEPRGYLGAFESGAELGSSRDLTWDSQSCLGYSCQTNIWGHFQAFKS